jgi:hypothetical protein
LVPLAELSRWLNGSNHSRYTHPSKEREPHLVGLGLSYPYLWLGDFAKVGVTEDPLSGAIVIWERFPAGFRHSPGCKRRPERNGGLAH